MLDLSAWKQFLFGHEDSPSHLEIENRRSVILSEYGTLSDGGVALEYEHILTQCRAEASLSEQKRRFAIVSFVISPIRKACFRRAIMV
jgi:hypothetical protein